MNRNNSNLVSSYLQYLPAILQEDPFMGRFLLAFEKILSGVKDLPSYEKIIQGNRENVPGLEEIINRVETYFHPQETPEQFLPWLAGWVALSLRDDWELRAKRAFIREIVKLYRIRGTKEGLASVLKLYLVNSGFGDNVEIFDQFDNFPNYFQVQLTLNDRDPEKYWRQSRIAKAIIDQEKPAHTFYSLKILVPTMQLTRRSQIVIPLYSLLLNSFKVQRSELQKFELEATVQINQPPEITENIINQITVRFQDENSNYHLLTPATVIKSNIMTIKRQYQIPFNISDNLKLTVKNLNNVEISVMVSVCVNMNIEGALITDTLLTPSNFNLAAVLPKDTLKICDKDQDGKIIDTDQQGTVFTILGNQSL